MHAVVIGAGAFGSWTALWLRRRGAQVTLIDQYGPGNSLSSSGDESRVTRSAHGADEHYPRWQRRALEQWRAIAPALFVPTGVLWLASRADGFEADSLGVLERLAIPAERLDPDALAVSIPAAPSRWRSPGRCTSRRPACCWRGAPWRQLPRPCPTRAARFASALRGWRVTRCSWTASTPADAMVLAAGPWLPKLLGPTPGLELGVPQQEIIYFATPPGDVRFDAGVMPTWVEYDAAFYGLPSIEGRGFKVAPDWPGPRSTRIGRNGASPTSG